jgi:hypothetical protein
MHKPRFIARSLLLLLILATMMLAKPMPALAQLAIISVQPSTVTGLTPVDLVITGTDFASGAVVIVENFGALTTSFVSSTVLTAVLPAGIDPGVYTVTVVNPDSTSVSLGGGLSVVSPTATSGPTTEPLGERPVLVVKSYSAGGEPVVAGKGYSLVIRMQNVGGRFAKNVVVVFTPGDFIPTGTGGVLATGEIDPGGTQKFTQPVTASYDIVGKSFATVVLVVSYTDPNGIAYSETFNLNVPAMPPRPGAFNTATPTPTLTPIPPTRPQLVITGYQTDLETLQPGNQFVLSIDATNKGNAMALQVSMIIGGGSSSSGGSSGTPEPGGVSGGSADVGTFAPVGSSNVQFLGDLPAGSSLEANAALIVNTNTNPGAYPLKISFTYLDNKGVVYTDDQVVTLLVYSVPQIDVNFYRPPDPLFVGQPGILPMQVVNIGRKAVVLGTMKVTSPTAELTNNEALIGPLDIGGYYTLDVNAFPQQVGTLDLLITINYTDDFSQPGVVTDTLSVEVMEGAPLEPIPGEGGFEGGEVPPESPPETIWQKVVRFVKGLFGLDSGVATPTPSPEEFMPEEPVPVPVQGPKG